jgi:hypothetical protein
MSEVAIDKLAEVYLTLRDKREVLSKEFESADKALKEKQEVLEAAMLDACKTIGANSINTSFGTIIKSVKERFWSTDRAAFNRFVAENDALDLFENRIHQGNMKTWIADHPDDFPPSVNIDRQYAITVRRPTKKG